MCLPASGPPRGDPLYEAGVQLGRLLRTIFLADYLINPQCRREILRVLSRGESTNSLKRGIYTGRVSNYQAKHDDEMQAVADALSLIANIVMAWNTAQMQKVVDHWNRRPRGKVPVELIEHLAPTRTEAPKDRRHQFARHVQLPVRAICRAVAAFGNEQKSSRIRRIIRCQDLLEYSDFPTNRNGRCVSTLREPHAYFSGKSAVFYRHFWH
jgi:hypothetical protein